MSLKQKSIPRVLSLDVFRGITIVLMIIVNSPGNAQPYGWLEHAAWNGCTFADVVFPFFIIIVGMSSVLALSNLKLKGVARPKILKKLFGGVPLFFRWVYCLMLFLIIF